MNEPILVARVEAPSGGRIRVLSPRVGWWHGPPSPGSLVGPGSRIGTLVNLNRRFALLLPDGCSGRVTGPPSRERSVAVEYGTLLFELAPLAAREDADLVAEIGALEGTVRDAPGEGHHVVIAPTDGVFYRSPSPGAAPFVVSGARVREGQPLGLIEVMKTFNQILYGGPGLPPDAEVLEIRAGDVSEVRAGDVLVVVR